MCEWTTSEERQTGLRIVHGQIPDPQSPGTKWCEFHIDTQVWGLGVSLIVSSETLEYLEIMISDTTLKSVVVVLYTEITFYKRLPRLTQER